MMSSVAVAGDAAEADNAAYQKRLLDIFFNVLLDFGQLFAFIGLLILSWTALKTVLNPTLIQQEGVKPMSIGKYLAGLAVLSMLVLPMQTMMFFNDFTGLYNPERADMGMCTVLNVTSNTYGWTNNASQCLDNVKTKVTNLAEYSNQDHIDSANLGLFFGAIQFASLGFFLTMTWNLLRHTWGARDLKITVGQSIIAMIIASAGMASPNISNFIEDFKGEQKSIVNT
jgi:hypothetical protein